MSGTAKEKAKKLNLMLAAVVAVLAVGFGVAYLVGWGQVFDKVEADTGGSLFGKIDKTQVQAIQIKGPKEEVDLKRKSDKDWLVTNLKKKVEGKDEWKTSTGEYKADQNAIEGVLREVTDLPGGRIISRKTDNLERFDLDEKNRIQVIAKGSNDLVLADFFLGKASEDITGCFVRKSDDAGVRKIDRNIRYTFDKSNSTMESWRDRTMLNVEDQTKIAGFVVEGAGRTVKLAKVPKPPEAKPEAKPEDKKEGDAEKKDEDKKEPEKDQWEITDPVKGPMESWSADSLKRGVAPLQADSFYEGDKKPADLGLEPPEFKVTILLEGKDPQVFLVGKEEDNKRYLQVPGQSQVFQASSYRVREFIKEPKDFLTAAAKKELEEKEKPKTEPGTDKAEKDKAPAPAPDAPPAGEKKPDGSSTDGGGGTPPPQSSSGSGGGR